MLLAFRGPQLLAHLLVAGLLVSRDWVEVRSGGSAYLFAFVLALALFTHGIGLVAGARSRWALPFQAWSSATTLVLAVLPWALFMRAWWRGREFMPHWAPAMATAVAAGVAIVATRPRWWAWLDQGDAKAARSRCLWAVVSVLGLLWLSDAMGTMTVVRVGAEQTHVGLALGTYGCTVLSAFLLGTRRTLAGDWAPRWLPMVVGSLATLLGVGLIEVERRMFVGLYPDLHLFLMVTGILWLDSGVGVLLACVRWLERPWVRRTAAVGCAIGLLPLLLPLVQGTELRASLERSSIGESVLYVSSVANPVAKAVPTPRHPALDYEQHFNVQRPARKYNILLVTVDALRADQVGRKKPTAPNLEKIARSSVVFERAYAQGSRTAIGMSSLMLGRYSANIDWRLWIYRGGRIYDPDELSSDRLDSFRGRYVYTTMPKFKRGRLLAERLKAAGYTTYAVPYAGQNEFFSGETGFHVGFDVFDDLTGKEWKTPTSDNIAKLVLDRLAQAEKGGRPWALWTHFYDPHESHGKTKVYRQRVKQFDRALGSILEHLKKRGLMEETIIAVTADHGEALGEHRHRGHASSLYDEQALVPMVLHVPGVTPGSVTAPVASVDLTATLAFLAGADLSALDGVNLLPLMQGNVESARRPVFTELHRYISNKGTRTADLKAVVLGRYKLIIDRRKQTTKLFDLERDPRERRNIASKDPEAYDELMAIAESFFSNAEAEHPLP